MNILPLFDLKSFHSSFRFVQEPDDTTADMFDSFVETSCPASPGMEHLLEEQMSQNKQMKSNVKFNKAFDVAKVCSEYLSKYNTETFLSNLETFKVFTELMRTGLPDDVKASILKYSSSSDASERSLSSSNVSERATSSTNASEREPSSAMSSQPSVSVRPQQNYPAKLRDLPEEHQVCTYS